MYKIEINQDGSQTFGIYTDYGYYYFKLYWCDFENGGWFLDILDVNQNPLVNGIPLVCNFNLTYQYKYIIPFDLIVFSEGNFNPGRYELTLMEMYLQ